MACGSQACLRHALELRGDCLLGDTLIDGERRGDGGVRASECVFECVGGKRCPQHQQERGVGTNKLGADNWANTLWTPHQDARRVRAQKRSGFDLKDPNGPTRNVPTTATRE